MRSIHYLVIGNGAAGLSAAEVIRTRDESARITIVSNESQRFYSRPGIAYYLSGQIPAGQLITRSESFYRGHRLDLLHSTVTSLDLEARHVLLENGQALPFDVLLLAMGASAVRPPFQGSDLDGVVTFDTLDDAKNIVALSRRAKRAVVVGGGITALELAEGLQHRGVRTTLLQRGDRVWPRLFDTRESAIIEEAIKHEGIEILYGEELSEIQGKKGRVRGVLLKSGKELGCQIVGVAIGVRPVLSLVEETSLEKDRGLLVNNHLQTNVREVFAAGDVAQVHDRWTGKHNLDVLWPSAINEGRAAGYNMVDIAHGNEPQRIYQKGSPFNAVLLFGVHLSVIGHVGNQNIENSEEFQHMSRGSSNVWTSPFSSRYRSAWDKKGTNSIRIVMSGGKIVGALIMGDQRSADPLRDLIENEVILQDHQQQLMDAGERLPELISNVWQQWRQSRL